MSLKVILNQTVPHLGKEGQVVTVKGGYARNFLFPRGLATAADRNQIKALEKKNARIAEKLAATKAAAVTLKEKIDGAELRIEGKVGRDSSKLFGAITSQDIADALKSTTGIEVEKKQVGLLEPIKRLGSYPITIDLHREVDAHIRVIVFDPEAAPEPVAEAPAEAVPEAAPEAEAVEA